MNKYLKLSSFGICISLWLCTGCSSNDVPEPDLCDGTLVLSLVDTDPVTNCDDLDGKIEVSASGGTAPYEFKLDNGVFQTSPVFNSNVSAGSHVVTVRDDKNCTSTVDAVVDILNSTLVADKVESDDTNCFGNNGSITITASGGVGPYDITLGSTTISDNPAVFTDLAPGTYDIAVEDAEGCIFPVTATVNQGNTGITYTGTIKDILEAKCNFPGCHPDNGDWFTYSVAKSNAASIKTRTGNGSMPKNDGAGAGGDLTATEIAQIACWVDDGAPE